MLYAALENWQPFLALAGLAALWLWESRSPFFQMTGRLKHAVRNLSVAGINAVATVLAFSALTAAAAAWGAGRGFGLLHRIEAPPWTAMSAAMISLDLSTYLWHPREPLAGAARDRLELLERPLGLGPVVSHLSRAC